MAKKPIALIDGPALLQRLSGVELPLRFKLFRLHFLLLNKDLKLLHIRSMSILHTALEPLEAEINAFEAQLPSLREKFPTGTYVLFVGSEVLGHFTSYAKALEAGYDAVGFERPFLVKQVSKEGEDVAHVYGLQAY